MSAAAGYQFDENSSACLIMMRYYFHSNLRLVFGGTDYLITTELSLYKSDIYID